MFECSTTHGTTVNVLVRYLIRMTPEMVEGECVRPVQTRVVMLCHTFIVGVVGTTNVNFDDKIMLFILCAVGKARLEPQTIAYDAW